jgi:hypothetical protein
MSVDSNILETVSIIKDWCDKQQLHVYLMAAREYRSHQSIMMEKGSFFSIYKTISIFAQFITHRN